METSQLADDIVSSFRVDETSPLADGWKTEVWEIVSRKSLVEFVQLVLDKAETVGGYDFADYDEVDDDDEDDDEDEGYAEDEDEVEDDRWPDDTDDDEDE